MTSTFPSSFQPIESKPEMPKSFQPMQNEKEIQPERTRIQSLTAAPVKGLLKGVQQQTELSMLPRGPIPAELANRAFDEFFPTQDKLSEKLLERTGRVATSLIGGGKGVASRAIRGGLSVLGGQIAEALGGSKETQQLVETGALLSPTVLKGTQKFVSGLYGQADKLAKGGSVSAKNLASQVRQFIKELEQGGTANSKMPTLKKLKEILSKIKNGKIDVKELTEFKKTINEARAGSYTDPGLDKVGKKLAQRNLNRASKIIDNSLGEYGKSNPEWNKVYGEANEAHGAIQNSKKVSRWISRIFKQHPHASGAAIAGSIIGHIFNPKAAVGVLAGAGALKSGELISRIIKSKVLRKYYADAIKQAVKENTSGFLNAMKKLSDNFSKEKEED